MKILQDRALVSRNGTFYFPRDEELTDRELMAFINYNAQHLRKMYRENMNLYTGKHPILNKPDKQTGDTSRLVVNLPKYITDTFAGYFVGVPPKITLEDKDLNTALQAWLKRTSFTDKLSRIARDTSIYGRSYGFIYQNEDSETRFTVSSPTRSFMVYDDTVEHKPLAFIRYAYLKNQSTYQAKGYIYYKDAVYSFTKGTIDPDGKPNIYGLVPASEFDENDTKTGIFASVKTLVNALNDALSQKANQVAYFDNAYLAVMGIHLPEKKDGTPNIDIKNNRFLYLPNIDPNVNPRVEFISKPDADQMQENLIQRLTDLIYQISMVPNLNDQAFAGNSSGVALQYKILPMQNLASTKERKFTASLRRLFQAVFSKGTVIPETHSHDWDKLSFTFTRNLPQDVQTAVNNARNAEGIVSKRTQLKLLPFVDDPDSELKQIKQEQADQIKNAQEAAGGLPDYIKSDDNDRASQTQETQEKED